jgi:hypothetical protein
MKKTLIDKHWKIFVKFVAACPLKLMYPWLSNTMPTYDKTMDGGAKYVRQTASSWE